MSHRSRCIRPECETEPMGSEGLGALLCRQHWMSATAPPPPLSQADRAALRRRWREEPHTSRGTVEPIRTSDWEAVPSELLEAILTVKAADPGATILRIEPRYGPLV